MLEEVSSAADFISKLMRNRTSDHNRLNRFRESLVQILLNHYSDHWFPEKRLQGSAYRCIRIVDSTMDPLLAKAASEVGLPSGELMELLPNEITLWVDPDEVSYRFGEEGSIGMLFDRNCGSDGSSEDDSSSDTDMSLSSSTNNSPAVSPTREFIKTSQCRNPDASLTSLYYNSLQGEHNLLMATRMRQMQFVAS